MTSFEKGNSFSQTTFAMKIIHKATLNINLFYLHKLQNIVFTA